MEQLFEQLGVNSIFALVGKVLNLPPEVAMHALCEDFYIRLVSDPRCLPYFANVSMGRMRNLQKTCLMEALGGPKVYKGLDLKTGAVACSSLSRPTARAAHAAQVAEWTDLKSDKNEAG